MTVNVILLAVVLIFLVVLAATRPMRCLLLHRGSWDRYPRLTYCRRCERRVS